MPTKRHDDTQRTQRSGRLTVTQPVHQYCTLVPRSVLRSYGRAMSCQIYSMQMVDPSRGSVVQSHSKVMHGPCRPPNRLALMTPVPPPKLSHTSCRSLTARADRPVRDPADAVAFTTAVAIGGAGAGSVHRRTGMRAAPPATDCRQNPPPAMTVNHIRCSADHRHTWRCEPRPDVRRAVGVCMMGCPRQAASVWHLAGHSVVQERGCKMILKEPYARAA